MDTSQWPQGIGVLNKAVEPSKEVQERKPRPQKEQANCPRCNSTNTKFCYYNNYSLSQPRYFCKTCRRYWTEGGSLRNVPVGGGSRKNKRCPSSSKKLPDLTTPLAVNPKTTNDLNFTDFMALPFTHDNKSLHASFMPISDANNTLYSSSSLPNSLHDFKPSLNFSLNGFEDHGYVNLQGDDQESSTVGAKLFFPLEDFKNVDEDNEFEQNRGQPHQSNGFWNGMLGGGSSW